MQPSSPAPISSPAPANSYTYIDKAGSKQTIQAKTPEEAISLAPNIDPHSGVQLNTPQTNNLINTSTKSRTDFSQNSSDLAAALAKISGAPTQENPNPNGGTQTPGSGTGPATGVDSNGIALNDPIMTGLNTLSTNSDAATKSLIASTIASYQTQRNSLTSQYENYKRGLQQLGVETGAAQSTPDLLAGHILQAGNEELTKINDLQAKESKALIDAQNAKATNDFKTLQAKMTYVKQVQTEKANAIKNMYDRINSSNKALAAGAHYELYTAFNTLDPKDQEAFITQVAQKYGVSPYAVVQALQDEKDKRDTADLKSKNAQSILDNRNKPKGSTATGGVSKAQIAEGTAELKKSQGSDGFYDPYVYIKAFQAWPGSTKAFVAAYPITGVNPKSYKILPEAFKSYLPKTSTSSRSSCWVAEVLFGVDHPKTHAARFWANSTDNWFTELYRKYGEGWAIFLKNNPWAKPIVQPIWELMAVKGKSLLNKMI